MKALCGGAMAVAAAIIAFPLLTRDEPARTLFTQVRVFDDQNEALIENANVVVTGNTIFRPRGTFQNT